ncbi:MAG: hypothetical protein V4438_03750 [Patescibacteria group bacterium]
METQNKSRVLKWSLIIGIMIVLNLFFNYSLSVVYSAPEYNNFCKATQVVEAITTKDACLAIGGQWNANNYPNAYPAKPVMDIQQPAGYCDQNFTCNKDFESASQNYDRNVFVTLVILGVATLGISMAIANIAISQGLSLGGVLSFVIASMRYWGRADDLIKVFILAVALAALIYLAYRKFGDRM